MALQEYKVAPGVNRVDGIDLTDLGQRDNIPVNSIQIVRGYVLGQSGSEYHFYLGLDSRLQKVGVFCDDTHRNGSDEYLSILKRISSQVGSEIDSATGEGKLVAPSDKKSLVAILNGVFGEFNVPESNRLVSVDYRIA